MDLTQRYGSKICTRAKVAGFVTSPAPFGTGIVIPFTHIRVNAGVRSNLIAK